MVPLLFDPAFRAEWRELARVEGPKIQKVVWGGSAVAMTGSATGGFLASKGIVPVEVALTFPQLAQIALAKYQGEFGALAAIQALWKGRREQGLDPRAEGRQLMEQPRSPLEGRRRAWLVRGVVAGGAAITGGAYATGAIGTLGAAWMLGVVVAAAWVAKRHGRTGQVAKPVLDTKQVSRDAWVRTERSHTAGQHGSRARKGWPWRSRRQRPEPAMGATLGQHPPTPGPYAPSLGQPPVPYPAAGWAEQYATPQPYAAPPAFQAPTPPQGVGQRPGERRTGGQQGRAAGGRHRPDTDGRRPQQGGREQS